jgi:hypothetical protein
MSKPAAAYFSSGHGAAVLDRPALAASVRPQPVMRYVPLTRLMSDYDLVPQAVLNGSIDDIARRAGTYVDKGVDDLDRFRGVGLKFMGIPCAIIAYQGHPEDTVSLYMPSAYKNVQQITRFVESIVRFLKLDTDAIRWQRSDDPEL